MKAQKYLFLFILACCYACSPADPDTIPAGVLSKEKMTGILAEIHLAEATVMATPHLGDTNARSVLAYYNFIYKKHGSNEKEFKASYDFYLHHPVLLDSVYSEVITNLSKEEAGLRGGQQ